MRVAEIERCLVAAARWRAKPPDQKVPGWGGETAAEKAVYFEERAARLLAEGLAAKARRTSPAHHLRAHRKWREKNREQERQRARENRSRRG